MLFQPPHRFHHKASSVSLNNEFIQLGQSQRSSSDKASSSLTWLVLREVNKDIKMNRIPKLSQAPMLLFSSLNLEKGLRFDRSVASVGYLIRAKLFSHKVDTSSWGS